MKLIMESWRRYRSGEQVTEGDMDIDQWMDQKLTDLPSPPISAMADEELPDITQGLNDGDPRDDLVIKGGVSGDVSFDNLLASQNEVGMAQSLRNTMAGVNGMEWDGIDWGDPAYIANAMKTPGFTFKFNDPIVIAETADGSVILDGHHRWSQAMMLQPAGKINVVGFNASPMSADDVLQALHLGIYAVAGQANIKPAKGGNLFGASAADIEGYMNGSERKVDPQSFKADPNGVAPYVAAYMQVNGISDPVEGQAAAVEYALKAIKAIAGRIVAGAPKRTKMPQTDVKVNPKATPAAVAAALDTGKVNYATPHDVSQTQRAKKAAE
tara:strand:- start:31 stop:1008 length:978 start_codon:yes stop_codon:yes gene_type:complete